MFEVLLLIDVLVLVHDPIKMFFPIVAGAWLGKYWAVEKRRNVVSPDQPTTPVLEK